MEARLNVAVAAGQGENSAVAGAAAMRRIPEEVFNQGNLALAAELFDEDYVEHTPGLPPDFPKGIAGFRLYVTMLREAFPDLRYTVEDEIAAGDKAAFRLAGRGTNAGPLFGTPATGRSAVWTETHVARIGGGKLVEHWACIDHLGMLQQLGIVATPGSEAMQPAVTLGKPLAAPSLPSTLTAGETRDLIARLFAALNRADIAALDNILDPAYADHTLPPGVPPTADGFKQVVGLFHAAFPDLHQTIEDVLVSGDKVVVRSTLRGTHRGEFLGIPATGRRIELLQIHVGRIAGTRLAEHWVDEDDLGMFRQLGVIAEGGQTPG